MGLSVFSVGGFWGVAESKDLDSEGPELKLSFAKHVSLGKALSVHLLLPLISMTDDMN